MNVRLFIIFWSDFVNREKNMILLSSVYNTDNSLTQDILCSTFGRFLIKKKRRKIYTHTTARSVKEVQLISYDWNQWKEKYQRYTHWNIMIMMIFHSGKNNRKKTDFLWIFKWEMLTSFSQNNVTLHNFSVLIIIQVLAVQCKYDEDIFNFSLLKSDQLEGVF